MRQKLTSVEPDLLLLERVVHSVSEQNTPDCDKNEERVDLVGVSELAEHESEDLAFRIIIFQFCYLAGVSPGLAGLT